MQLVGKSASNGVALGKALVLKTAELVIPKTTVADVEGEVARLQSALQRSKKAVQAVRDHALRKLGADKAEIFDAHLLVLDDPELVGEAENVIRAEKLNASAAFQKVAQNFIAIFEGMDNEYMRERAADIRDISDRVLRTLGGIEIPDLSTLQDEVILVAHDLAPSETATVDPSKVLGILTNIGGKTSHTAIVARTLEIPAVLGLKKITESVKSGEWIAMDGESGEVELKPDEATKKAYLERQARQRQDKTELQALVGQPNATSDGHKAELVGNIGSPQDLPVLKKYDAAGVGLYRTEFLYMKHSKMPSEEEQYHAYKAVLEGMSDKPITIRTLDIGGDKNIPYMNIGKEDNPFLGYRAVRYCLDNVAMFRTQLRALLRASAHGTLRIMFPMISSVDEFLACREHVEAVRKELTDAKVPMAAHVPLGVMIEIPSAALVSDHLAEHAEFLSIGTNDLIQYTVAVDRLNERVQNLYDPFHPGVLRLIQTVIANGHKHGRKVSMCGDMGGSELHLPLLLGMGLDEFSMAPTLILRARRQLRSWTLGEAKDLAASVSRMNRSSDIEAALNQALKTSRKKA
jgi:phosphotransferase system enzyme I (PtsI)